MKIKCGKVVLHAGDGEPVEIEFAKIKTIGIASNSFLEIRPNGTVIWHQHNIGDPVIRGKDEWEDFAVVVEGVVVG